MNMQFVNIRNNNPYINNSIAANNSSSPLYFTRRNNVQRYISEPISKPKEIKQIKEVVPVSKNDPKKIKWGAPTWYLFHTLAYKIKDECFSILKNELLNNIFLKNLNNSFRTFKKVGYFLLHNLIKSSKFLF